MPEGAHSRRGLRARHEALRDLLDRNGRLLELLADIQLDLRLLVPGDPVVRSRTLQLSDTTLLQAETLNILSEDGSRSLYGVHARLDAEIRRVLEDERRRLREDPLTRILAACGRADQPLVGGKAARLGELAAKLPERVPPGFVVTTAAYARFLAHGQTGARLRDLVKDLDPAADPSRLRSLAGKARRVVLEAPVPDEIVDEIRRRAAALHGAGSWAVRSSAVGEDGPFSFAGQFETLLHVPEPELPSAWRSVVASSFSEHVIRYRLACGLFELATPMAVLCMPMVEARLSGVLYTRDPAQPEGSRMLVSAMPGLAPDLVGGVIDAETTFVSRETFAVSRHATPRRDDGPSSIDERTLGSGVSEDDLVRLARLGLECERLLEGALDVEWAIGQGGQACLLQARPLASGPVSGKNQGKPASPCLARGGLSIVGGRAVGEASMLDTPNGTEGVPEGGLLVVPQAAPELGHLLPRIAGLVAEHGSVTGHLASLAREFGVPSVFGMADATTRLESGQTVSLNATHCEVYAGEAWPREGRDARRQARAMRSGARSPLHPLILRLNLTDPRSASFRPKGCRSLHDVVRLCHERGIAALFERARWRQGAPQAGARLLRGAALPDGVWVLDAGGGVVRTEDEELEPQQVRSRPFQALWRGMTAPGISWTGRRIVDLRGLASVVTSSMTEADRDADGLGGAAYLVVASDYVNFNARMAYHYAMIDSLVGESPETNYVSFRFWGGGAGRAQRDLRALFLAGVLERVGFAVERRGDLVTARMQRYAGSASEAGLEALGKLMGCARQLDMLLHTEAAVALYVDRFLEGAYEEFA